MIELRIGPTDQLLIAGQNGSGKSVLATHVGRAWERVLVYDGSHDPNAILPNAAVCYGARDAARSLPGRVVYRPLPTEDRAEAWDRLCWRVYRSGAHGIVCHEALDLGSSDAALGPWWSACLRQGRGRRIPRVIVTQRPFYLPQLYFSEASAVACFFLLNRRDRERMAEVMGELVLAAPVAKDYSFWYRDQALRLEHLAPLPPPGPPQV